MAVTSIRLGKDENKILEYLKSYYSCDTTTILKKSLFEMYEIIKDREIICEFEKNEKEGKTSFSGRQDMALE